MRDRRWAKSVVPYSPHYQKKSMHYIQQVIKIDNSYYFRSWSQMGIINPLYGNPKNIVNTDNLHQIHNLASFNAKFLSVISSFQRGCAIVLIICSTAWYCIVCTLYLISRNAAALFVKWWKLYVNGSFIDKRCVAASIRLFRSARAHSSFPLTCGAGLIACARKNAADLLEILIRYIH